MPTATIQSKYSQSGIYRYLRPWLSISTAWLGKAGFTQGTKVKISSPSKGVLIIKAEQLSSRDKQK